MTGQWGFALVMKAMGSKLVSGPSVFSHPIPPPTSLFTPNKKLKNKKGGEVAGGGENIILAYGHVGMRVSIIFKFIKNFVGHGLLFIFQNYVYF